MNAASYWPGLPPWGIASLFGTGLTNVRGVITADKVPLPTELAGTSVYVDGNRAPIFAVANIGGQEQINFQVPVNAGVVRLGVCNNSVCKEFFTLLSNRPGIFVSNGQPAIQHGSDYSPVSFANPARRGEAIVIYATGLGATTPAVPIGSPAPFGMLSTCSSVPRRPPLVRIGGTNAALLFCGLAPGFVGLYQLNVEVPADAPSGLADLAIIETTVGEPSNTVKLPVE
ncbi:MAG: hypothetical protein HY649_05415 [Acidobacteria bacterium]|nr:hypothetical protein [Acidobacteriota bacterium]